MSIKYKTKIEITSEAHNKDEAIDIVGEYLSGNIASGIDMKCTTKRVSFYNHTATKIALILVLIAVGFLSGTKTKSRGMFYGSTCQVAAVQPPLKTADPKQYNLTFKKEWEEKLTPRSAKSDQKIKR